MNTIPCEHPRQRGTEFRVPGATPGELDQEIHCAVPGCPAGFDIGTSSLLLCCDCPTEPGVLRPESEREKMITLKRVQTNGIWRWLAMPIINGHAQVPDDFLDWLEAQIQRLAQAEVDVTETLLPYKAGDVLRVKMFWGGKEYELAHRFDGAGPLRDASVGYFKTGVEGFPAST